VDERRDSVPRGTSLDGEPEERRKGPRRQDDYGLQASQIFTLNNQRAELQEYLSSLRPSADNGTVKVIDDMIVRHSQARAKVGL
jgi:hypothetical protein